MILLILSNFLLLVISLIVLNDKNKELKSKIIRLTELEAKDFAITQLKLSELTEMVIANHNKVLEVEKKYRKDEIGLDKSSLDYIPSLQRKVLRRKAKKSAEIYNARSKKK